MIHGSCLCGAVRYELQRPAVVMYHCHCSVCRKASGAGFATNVLFPTEALRLASDSVELGHHESSPGRRRYFCRSCGSPIYSHDSARPAYISVRSGTLAGDPGVRPSMHLFVASRAPWVAIDDDLRQYPEAWS